MRIPAKRACATVLAVSMSGLATTTVAAASNADIDTQAVVRKTVVQQGDARGQVHTSSMYTQVSVVGQGSSAVSVPVGTSSVRNLNGFGSPPVINDAVQFDAAVAGNELQRVLTDADLQPLQVSVSATLNGLPIDPNEVVNQSGVLEVSYTVTNTTARSQPVSYQLADGTTVTENMQVSDPFVGTLNLELPGQFTQITAPGATVAGNGQNGNLVGFQFVLFEPLGQSTQTVRFQSRIFNGSLPAAEFAFLPIIPYDNSTVASTKDAYAAGAQAGAQIADAGVQIGDNLLKLQNGASQLLAGLIQLETGASQLATGLAALDVGANQLNSGVGQIVAQSPALVSGINQLDTGANSLSSGLREISTQGVPQLQSGVNELAAGAAQLDEAMNNPDPTKGLAAGAQAVNLGISQVVAGLQQAAVDANNLYAQVQQDPGFQQLIFGLQTLQTLIPTMSTSLGSASAELDLAYSELTSALGSLNASESLLAQLQSQCGADAACISTTVATAGFVKSAQSKVSSAQSNGVGANQLISGVAQSLNGNQPTTALGILTQIRAGIDTLVLSIQDQLVQQTQQSLADPQLAELIAGSGALAAGAQQAADGAAELDAGIQTELVPGVQQLGGYIQLAADGSTELAAGLDTLAGGAGQLTAGLDQLYAGTQQLADGADQAAAGAPQLVDGLGQAVAGEELVVAGAGDLKTQGADVLAQTGAETAKGFAVQVAQLDALQQAALKGAGIPYGPATGAQATTGAYQLTLAAASHTGRANLAAYALAAIIFAGAIGTATWLTRSRLR